MTKDTRMRTVAKTSLATSLAVVAAGASGNGLASFTFKGSDTLTDVVRESISNAGLTADLVYSNTGSGSGETAALAGTQTIVPMSRNWKSSVLAATSHPTWAPQLRNVIGLDAAVIIEAFSGPTGYRTCKNLTQIALEADKKHAQNGNILQLLLGGVDGAGTEAACRDQRRLDAIDYVASVCFGGISQLDHFYRRDDRSGTADTMKERLRIQRFCSGRAPGVDASGNDYNLNNDDADPVRRACVGQGATRAKTVCTLWPATTQCQDTPTATGCTQGFVVALSQTDPGSTDITTSIGNRVNNDSSAQTIGFAGRAGSRVAGATSAMVKSVSATDLSVRNANYFLARRLFINWADTNTPQAAETTLYNWMTDPNGDPLPGRWNVDKIMSDHGFLPCTTDHSDPTATDNLCNSEWPIPVAESTPAQCVPPGENAVSPAVCCSTGAAASPCTAYPAGAVTQGCLTDTDCNTGLTCQDMGVGHLECCVGGTEAGQACAADADCCTNKCGTAAPKTCCYNTTGTKTTGTACAAATECCSNSCSTTGVCCAGPGSIATGQPCNMNADCCSNSCSAANLCN